MRETVLVTGATGFIGRHLTAALLASPDRWRVRALARSDAAEGALREAFGDAGVAVVRGDVGAAAGGEEALRRACRGADVVVHLAAHMDFFPDAEGEAAMEETNVRGTARLYRAAARAGARRFVHVSSTEAVGPTARGAEPVGEDEAEPAPTSAYGRSKLAGERALAREADAADGGPSLVVLRPTGVFGPGDRFAVYEMMRMIEQGVLCFVPGSGEHSLMFTHVDDVVRAVVLASGRDVSAEALEKRTFFVSPDEALSYGGWVRFLHGALRRAGPFFRVPMPLCKAGVAALAPLCNRGKARVFMYKTRTLDNMTEDRSYSNERARRLLGFEPRFSVEHGLADTIRWERSRGHFRGSVCDPLSPVLIALLALLLAVALAVTMTGWPEEQQQHQ